MAVLEICFSFTPSKIQAFNQFIFCNELYIVFVRLGGRHSWRFETDQQIGNEECQHRSHHNPLFTKKNVNNRIAGMIILGGGLIKHHICNANLMRNGADFSLFVNTASEFDGSDSGAR